MQAEVLQATQSSYANSTWEDLRKYSATTPQLQLGDVLYALLKLKQDWEVGFWHVHSLDYQALQGSRTASQAVV